LNENADLIGLDDSMVVDVRVVDFVSAHRVEDGENDGTRRGSLTRSNGVISVLEGDRRSDVNGVGYIEATEARQRRKM